MRKPIPTNEEVVALFSKHFVPIHFYFRKNDIEHHAVVSTFIVSIRNAWFLVTAGHCLREVEKNITNHGCVLEQSQLIDYGGINALHFHGVPFDYLDSPKQYLENEMYDYGIIYLKPYYINLLKQNNVAPLTEEVWEKQPIEPDSYFLLGVPKELTEVKEDTINITTSFNRVEKCEQRPDCFEKTEAPTFYGKIELDENNSDIGGMSGGPIFAFKRTESGKLKYWLFAIQSRWNRSQRLIAACIAKPFINHVKEVMEEIEKKIV